jgi:hypothetical protein
MILEKGANILLNKFISIAYSVFIFVFEHLKKFSGAKNNVLEMRSGFLFHLLSFILQHLKKFNFFLGKRIKINNKLVC